MTYELNEEDIKRYTEEIEKKEDTMKINAAEFASYVSDEAHSMIQPILYMKKPKENSILYNMDNRDKELLHVSPIISTADINSSNILYKAMTDKSFKENLGPSFSYLSSNQKEIAILQFTNYIIQNTNIAFCAMIDNTGDIFRKMILNTRIKQYVYDELSNINDDYEHSCVSVFRFISSYVYRSNNNSYQQAFNVNSHSGTKEEMNKTFDALMQNNSIVANQLNQLIYTKLCIACDKAISEILLGIRISPNLSYILDAGVDYFKLNPKNMTKEELRYEIYYRLNLSLVDMLNKLMCSVITDMSTNLFAKISYLSYYYIFGVYSDEYYHKLYEERSIKPKDTRIPHSEYFDPYDPENF